MFSAAKGSSRSYTSRCLLSLVLQLAIQSYAEVPYSRDSEGPIAGKRRSHMLVFSATRLWLCYLFYVNFCYY
jgi:hypothetical protein